MSDLFAPAGWATFLVVVAPTALITICVVVVALATLAARRPATRRHCLAVIAHLIRYVVVLRGRR